MSLTFPIALFWSTGLYFITYTHEDVLLDSHMKCFMTFCIIKIWHTILIYLHSIYDGNLFHYFLEDSQLAIFLWISCSKNYIINIRTQKCRQLYVL